MSVLVNFKICDNSKECGGIGVCPTGALSFDNNENSIVINNEKCISCGLCERECPIGAIQVAKTIDEYNKIKQEIDDDKRTTKDLFVDRYGATPLSEFFMIDSNNIENKIDIDNLVLVELYNDDSIQCLLKSISIKELTKDLSNDVLFYKMKCDDITLEKYGVEDLPSLLVFKSGKLLGMVSGYYIIEDKDQLICQLKKIIKTVE